MSLKDTKIIDLNLFSGSSELFRQAIGCLYYDSGDGSVEFNQANVNNIDNVESFENSDLVVDNSNILPKFMYSNRAVFQLGSSNIVSDEDWRKFIIGGVFGNKEYPGIINTSVYSDHYNTSSLPKLPQEVVNTNEEASLSLTTEYYNYYRRYQAEVSDLESELMAPNYYSLNPNVLEYFDTDNSCLSSVEYTDMKFFLSSSFVNETKEYNSIAETIFIVDPSDTDFTQFNGVKTTDTSENISMDSDLNKLYSLMPFGNKLEIDLSLTNSDSKYKDVFSSNSYKLKILKLLKEVFQGESGLPTSLKNFAVNTTSLYSTGIQTGSVESTVTLPVNLVDLPTMLLYSYRNPSSETNNITVINSGSYLSQTDYIFDDTGIYRYENTKNTLEVFNDVIDEIKTSYATRIGTDGAHAMSQPLIDFFNQSNQAKYDETIAFRIQKIGGGPTGDYNTENTIQNIWFYNEPAAITYLDTQVKYDTDYTYKIYKYDIVEGYKYQLSDVAVTRQIALTSSGDSDVYCLEFYDPLTNLSKPKLLETSNALAVAQERLTTLDAQISPLKSYRHTIQNIALPSITSLKDILNTFELQRSISLVENTDMGAEAIAAFFDPQYADFFESEFFLELADLTEYEPSRANPSMLFFPVLRLESEAGNFIESPMQFPELPSILYPRYYYPGDGSTGTATWGSVRVANTETSALSVIDLIKFHNEGPIDLGDLFNDLDTNESELNDALSAVNNILQPLEEEKAFLENVLNNGLLTNTNATDALINSSYPYLADFNVTIEPSVKVVEIPLEEKRMRIIDHPPNNFLVTPHHLLDQSNRLAFYCKYDTFSTDAVTYPPAIAAQDAENKSAYLTGHNFVNLSEQTQESVSAPRFIEVYRTTTKPTSYTSFAGSLRKTIDLRQTNGDIPLDHLFVERVRENTKYYYAFRALNENRVAGQMSPIFESELINDGGYVYGAFQQYSEDELSEPLPKEPLMAIKKLVNIVPNIQHLQLDTTTANFASSSVSQLGAVDFGTQPDDPLWDAQKYFKIRLTSKKTSKKIDLNIVFKKEERK